MHPFQRTLGIIPFLLGAIGLLVSVILAIAFWIAGERIEKLNTMLFAQADRLFEIADRQMVRASQGLHQANDMLAAAELGLQQDFDQQQVKDFLARPEVQSIELKLRRSVEEIEGLIQTIETSEEILRQGSDSLSFSFAKSRRFEGTFLETLGKARIALLRLMRAVSDAEACWISLNQGQELENNARNLLRMNELIQRQLVEVGESVTVMRERCLAERKAWTELSQTSASYIKIGQSIGIGILAWIGFGQYALALCGVLRLRNRPVSGPAH